MSFAVWLTGLPASGKTAIARALAERLAVRTSRLEVLDSDDVRRWLTPRPSYDAAERELFYRALAFTAARLVAHGVVVVIAATAHQRAHRDWARSMIPRLLEVWVDTPIEVCRSRDPKGLYRRAAAGSTLPGAGVEYEAPLAADLRVDGAADDPLSSAAAILRLLSDRGWL